MVANGLRKELIVPTRDEIKEDVFDILVEILEATGTPGSVTPEAVAKVIGEKAGRVKGCMRDMVDEDILATEEIDDETYYRLSDETYDQIIEEMIEAGVFEEPTLPDESDS